MTNFPSTVKEMREALELLEAQGFGDRELLVMQYAGGDDEAAYMNPVAPTADYEPVVMQTRFVR